MSQMQEETCNYLLYSPNASTLLLFYHRPYGTALVKNSSYTNIVAIGTGTGEFDTVPLY